MLSTEETPAQSTVKRHCSHLERSRMSDIQIMNLRKEMSLLLCSQLDKEPNQVGLLLNSCGIVSLIKGMSNPTVKYTILKSTLNKFHLKE